MDEILNSVYRQMIIQHQASAEDILECPLLRQTFLNEVRQILGDDLPERQLLHRLSYLRKQSKLPRSRDVLAACSKEIVSGVKR